jgi:hypothetical protein
MASTLTKEQFTKKANEIHNSKYSYEKTIYVNMRKPITIICKKHGEFKQSPMNHLKTEGCPKCGYEGRHEKKEVPPDEPKASSGYSSEYSDDELKKIFDNYAKKIKGSIKPINPFEPNSKFEDSPPKAVSAIQSIIPLNDEMLMNAEHTGMLVYEDIDTKELDGVVDSIESVYDHNSHVLNIIRRVVEIDWNSIALNPTFTFDNLIKYKSHISIDYLVHSPAFLLKMSMNSLSIKSQLVSVDEFKILNVKYKTIMTRINLADDWFEDADLAEYLYSTYLIPRLINYGYKITKTLAKKFNSRLIDFCIQYIAKNGDSNSLMKIPNMLNSLPERLFIVVYEGITFSPMRNNYLLSYMTKNYLTDNTLERLLTSGNQSVLNTISSTQVPSIEFINKYRDKLDVILIIRNMIKNNRVLPSFIEEFIDDIMEYNKKRDEVFVDANISFMGSASVTQYACDADMVSLGSELGFSLDMSKSINYIDKNGRTSELYKYYSEDVLKNIYTKTTSKLFKKLYETVRFDNGKNNDMVASIQSELETLLNNSKQLQEKLNKFKKSI